LGIDVESTSWANQTSSKSSVLITEKDVKSCLRDDNRFLSCPPKFITAAKTHPHLSDILQKWHLFSNSEKHTKFRETVPLCMLQSTQIKLLNLESFVSEKIEEFVMLAITKAFGIENKGDLMLIHQNVMEFMRCVDEKYHPDIWSHSETCYSYLEKRILQDVLRHRFNKSPVPQTRSTFDFGKGHNIISALDALYPKDDDEDLVNTILCFMIGGVHNPSLLLESIQKNYLQFPNDQAEVVVEHLLKIYPPAKLLIRSDEDKIVICDIQRANAESNESLTFGFGSHRCLGSQFAKDVGKVYLEFLRRGE